MTGSPAPDPRRVTDALPISPRDVIRAGLCIGCGACVAAAEGHAARMELDGYGEYVPAGDRDWLRRRTSMLARTCPFSPDAPDEDALASALFPAADRRHSATGPFLTAYVGAVAEGGYRTDGSSGGMVSWTLAELLRRRLIDGVAHVAPADPAVRGRFFEYRISRTEDEVRAGARSRYYPVELSGVLQEIRAAPGRYAVVGVPCFIKAVQLLRRRDPVIRERVRFTAGLFCGHMKSARMAESFAWQMGAAPSDVARIEFRVKDPTRPARDYIAELELRDGRVLRKDWWHLAEGDWGSGFFQNAACNFCDDVVAETADISFGDAWVEPYASDGRGTNVVIVRTPALDRIVAGGIREGRLELEPVDADFVARTQEAGLRQRREGLAYRLTWRRPGMSGRLLPRKRVQPSRSIPARRKRIYRFRSAITFLSHRVFRLARAVGRPDLFVRWGWTARKLYHRWAYGQRREG